ncbi:TPA: 23S rRNA (pseudouridine(1915)-N(3))-methyltransferase RlmH, partial [Staphylococcus pseudintermedius]|nr:23S rRNA (pseudouridine(1915)-N(3))-methyltransferase RlmH [Staphylococcus pseudintermedius]
MKITILAVGKLKEKYWKLAIAEYTKRLGAYTKIEVVEVPDEKAPETMSAKEIEQVKEKEGQRILS